MTQTVFPEIQAAIEVLERHFAEARGPQSHQGLGAFSHGHLMLVKSQPLKLTLFRVLHSWAVTPGRSQWTG